MDLTMMGGSNGFCKNLTAVSTTRISRLTLLRLMVRCRCWRWPRQAEAAGPWTTDASPRGLYFYSLPPSFRRMRQPVVTRCISDFMLRTIRCRWQRKLWSNAMNFFRAVQMWMRLTINDRSVKNVMRCACSTLASSQQGHSGVVICDIDSSIGRLDAVTDLPSPTKLLLLSENSICVASSQVIG